MTDREFVESRWVGARYDQQSGKVLCYRPGGGEWILSGNPRERWPPASAWLAARITTEAHQGQIQQVNEEIAWLKKPWLSAHVDHLAVDRLLAGALARREELHRGWRPMIRDGSPWLGPSDCD